MNVKQINFQLTKIINKKNNKENLENIENAMEIKIQVHH